MFRGTYEHGMDAKGRVIIPAKLREELGESFVVTWGLDSCLYAYPMAAWEAFEEKLANIPNTNERARKLVRNFTANAEEYEMDKQGRVLISPKLRKKAGLTKEVVFVGVLKKIEIWSKEKWSDIEDVDDLSDLADSMEEYGLTF